MPGSRFHPYLSTHDVGRLTSMTASTTCLETPFPPYSVTNKTDLMTQSILNSSLCPLPVAPRQMLSTPYTAIEGTGWQPEVGWPSCQYWPMDQNLAMEQQKRTQQQQHFMEALKHQQQMEAPKQHRTEALQQHQQQMEAPKQHQTEALQQQQQQWMEASNQQQQQMDSPMQQQQQWMEAPNLMFMADSSQEYIRFSREYIRYMEDSSQEYIRYMDQLRHISASVPSMATVPILPTLPVLSSCQSPMQDLPLNLSLKDRFEDSTRGSSELSTTHSSSSSDSMLSEKLTGSNTSPEPSLVKLSDFKTESSSVKLTLPKKRSYEPNSAQFTEFDKLSSQPSLVKLSDPIKPSSESSLIKISGGKKPSDSSSVLLILSKNSSAEPPLVKLTGCDKRPTGLLPGRLTGSENFSLSKPSPKPSSATLIDFETTSQKTSSEKLTNSKNLSSEPVPGLAVKLHATKPIEAGGLDAEVSRMFPCLRATDMGTIVLWNFLWALLKDQNYHQVIRWIDHPNLKFKIFQPQELVRLWGIVKKNTSMNLDKLMKVIHLYLNKDILKQVDEKFVFQFALIPDSAEHMDSEKKQNLQWV